MAVSIRLLTEQDEAFLWDILYLAIYVPEGQPLPSREVVQEPSLAHYVSQWSRRAGDLGFIALEQGDRPVGAAWLRLFAEHDKGYGYVNDRTPELSIAIVPEYRWQGIGQRLLEALLQAASETYTAVSLSVSRGNPAARLYCRLGFEVVTDDGNSQTMLKRFA